ncbi:hypothetical protein F9C11_17760 [Amycolatopsis sp. VS8301801F10]
MSTNVRDIALAEGRNSVESTKRTETMLTSDSNADSLASESSFALSTPK